MSAPFTPGPWSVGELDVWNAGSNLPPEIGLSVNGSSWGKIVDSVTVSDANARLIAAAPSLYDALSELADLFAHDGENSVERFERLAAAFRKDTGYLAPGKDQPASGPDQPDGDELRAIYDGWYQAKVDRARAALALARGEQPA